MTLRLFTRTTVILTHFIKLLKYNFLEISEDQKCVRMGKNEETIKNHFTNVFSYPYSEMDFTKRFGSVGLTS
jgi:hypothetical protein